MDGLATAGRIYGHCVGNQAEASEGIIYFMANVDASYTFLRRPHGHTDESCIGQFLHGLLADNGVVKIKRSLCCQKVALRFRCEVFCCIYLYKRSWFLASSSLTHSIKAGYLTVCHFTAAQHRFPGSGYGLVGGMKKEAPEQFGAGN